MLSDGFADFVRKVPFRPYRFVTSDGRRYEIPHTDFALVLDDSVVVFLHEKDPDQLSFKRSILLSLTHVIRIEFMDDDLAATKRKRRRKPRLRENVLWARATLLL